MTRIGKCPGQRGVTCQVGKDVIGDDEGAGQQEPDDAVEDVGDEKGGGYEHEEQDEVRPGVLPKLVHVAALLQPEHKPHKPCTVMAAHQAAGTAPQHISAKATLTAAASQATQLEQHVPMFISVRLTNT